MRVILLVFWLPLLVPSLVAAQESRSEKAPDLDAQPAAQKTTPAQLDKPDTSRASQKPNIDQKDTSQPFIKSELSNFIGSTKLVTTNNRAGVMLGYRQIGYKHYATVNPEVNLRISEVDLGFGVPLAFELFDGTWDNDKDNLVGFSNAGRFRSQDWDEPGEYARFIRYITYGKKEDPLFFNISQYASTSVGHGTIMRRYSTNIDPDSTRVAGEMDAYNDYAGFELVTNNIVEWDILGGIAFFKPLSIFSSNPIARSLSIGVTYLVDRKAPVRLKTDHEGLVNPYWIMGTGRPDILSHAPVHALGVDLEIKLLKTDQIDLKPFIDISWLVPGTPTGQETLDPSGGEGITVGVLGRINLGKDPIHVMRAILELRSYSANYLPGYFDTFYEIHKYIANFHYSTYATNFGMLPPTKFVDVFVNRKGQDRHLGFYLEFNYALPKCLALTLALEGSNAVSGNNFLAHLEVPVLSWMQFFFSFHQHAMDNLGDLLSKNGRDKFALGSLRLRMLPFLFFNFRYYYTFKIREDLTDLDGDGFENQYRFYKKVEGWLANFELGWEF